MDFSAYLTQLKYLMPELGLTLVALAAMFVHLFRRKNGVRAAGIVSLSGSLGVLCLLFLSPLSTDEIYSGTLVADRLAFFLKVMFLMAAALSIGLAFRFFDAEGFESGEVYYLLLFAVVGMMFTAGSVDLIAFYVAFELFAICSYILAAIFKKERRSAEAGIKYFVLGVLSSGIMLLGMALLYGLTGETVFAKIAKTLEAADFRLAVLAAVLFLVGLFFKLAMVPFHMWAPDVYEGAPTPLVVFLSTAPKAAVFAVLLRVSAILLPAVDFDWPALFGATAVVTMTWGNLAALMQQSIKRMMAYSSIAHAGYMMIAIAAFGGFGNMALLFYLFIYVFMNSAAFGLILLVRRRDGFGEKVDDLNGFAQRSPLMAAAIIVVLLSLTGIPPTAGFIGKYYLFAAAVEQGMYYLAVAGAVNSVISLFYYFRIGRAMFMAGDVPGDLDTDHGICVKTVIAIASIAILFLGIWPAELTEFAALSCLR